ncbi:MAG TPA: ABC transporter ATP-binding protein, partial [Chloroflexi bacterium]|nr:ABC transporter ATP-binding protein [Chloroflexota bacterium]
RGANLLLLDEPTNHLDIPSQEILEAVLADFEGTILLVSHDRYLIRNLATQIWALHTPRRARGGRTEVVIYEGPYEEYLVWRNRRREEAGTDEPEKQTARRRPPEPEEAAALRERQRLTPYQRRKRLAEVEERIHQIETTLADLSAGLEAASSTGDVGEVARLGEEYARLENELETLMDEWEQLSTDA